MRNKTAFFGKSLHILANGRNVITGTVARGLHCASPSGNRIRKRWKIEYDLADVSSKAGQ
jgi:hypothetical protein